MKPGEYFLENQDITANQGRETATVRVENTGDRPIQIGSHFHFFEVNRFLKFDRDLALGMRLNIPSGTAVRFEPGQRLPVELVKIGGTGNVHGFNRLTEGDINDEELRKKAIVNMKKFCQDGTSA
jgi:urease subunit beta